MIANVEDWLPRHRLTVEEYYRMGEVGLLAEDARVELIEGEIIDMSPPGSRHSGFVTFLTQAFSSAVGKSALVWVQAALRLSRMSEPQPDLMLLRPRPDFYASTHPGARDVFLVVEVSESSLRQSLLLKKAADLGKYSPSADAPRAGDESAGSSTHPECHLR